MKIKLTENQRINVLQKRVDDLNLNVRDYPIEEIRECLECLEIPKFKTVKIK